MTKTFNTTDYALYLPAVNSNYANIACQNLNSARPFPKNLSLTDLSFWNRGTRLFYYPYILHSIGQYSVGSRIDNAITRGGRTDSILFGDSGGFQIGSGTLSGYKALKPNMSADDAIDAWYEADDVRSWIVTWLETYCNYAMTLDMPLWSTSNKSLGTPFNKCSVKQLTDMTVDNLRYIDMNRQDKTKWLNVVQGVDEKSINEWFDAVKWFKHGGWALAGTAGVNGGLKSVLKTVLMMRDADAFSDGQDWLHVLGTSTLNWAVMLTAIQRALQKTNANIRVSFDSSSPFQIAAKFEKSCFVPELSSDVKTWQINSEVSKQGLEYVGSDKRFPHNSAIGQVMTLGELNVYEGVYKKRRYDSISLAMLTNHNVNVYLETIEMANDIAFKQKNSARLPDVYKRCLDVVFESFEIADWNSYLDNNCDILEQLK